MMSSSNDHISFTKMQGAGNDFVVLDNRFGDLSSKELIELTPKICDRKFGVGSDGLLALMPPEVEGVDFTMFYRNPDGSDAGMCGNGARCLAKFAHSLGFADHQTFSVHKKVYEAEIVDEDTVRLSFPMEASPETLTIEGKSVYAIQTGTEHIVTPVDQEQLDDEDFLRDEGNRLRYHDQFEPIGTNVNFICGLAESELRLQTYERGVEDLTLACGTGAIASALIWHHLRSNGKSTEQASYSVRTKGGTLKVYFSYESSSQSYTNIKLEGPAHFVFTGEYNL